MLKSTGKTLFSFFTFGLLLLLMNTAASMAQSSINKSNIKIEVDLESAQAIIALFDKGKPSEADFTKLLE
jgi:hypothetical protein